MPLHMRTPKLRGFKNPFRVEYQVVNLDKLAELYPTGGDVTVSDLVAKGAVRKNEKVKVLGTGDISVKLTVAVDKVSGSAEQKIVAAGGSSSKSTAGAGGEPPAPVAVLWKRCPRTRIETPVTSGGNPCSAPSRGSSARRISGGRSPSPSRSSPSTVSARTFRRRS
jgi:hypothetical protein